MVTDVVGRGGSTTLRPGAIREREDELRALNNAVRSAASGTGEVAIVGGPPGVGKTRLLDVATTLASRAGLEVLVARATELERPLPFGVALQLLEGVADVDAVFDNAPVTGSAEERQLVIGHGLYRALTDLAPTALVIDDLHWADSPSLRWLAYVARRAGPLPLVMVAATRLAEPGADGRLIDELTRLPGARQLRPRLLSDQATTAILTELLQTPLEAGFAQACFNVTEGNPLLVRELARSLREAGTSGTDENAEVVRTIGPEAVAWSVDATLRHLPAGARTLAEAVSVLGDRGNLPIAAALAAIEMDVARDAVDRMQRAELLLGEHDLRFAHPLLRQAVLAGLAPADREALEARAAELLAAEGDPTAAAEHLLRCPPAGHAWAVDALSAAAATASRRAAPAYAVELLERALAEPAAPGRLPTMMSELARLQALAGDNRAAQTYSRAIELTPDPAAGAGLLLALAWTHQSRGHFALAVRAAEQGLALEHGDAEIRTELEAMRNAARLWSPADDPVPTLARTSLASRVRTRADRVALADEARRRLFEGVDFEGASDLARRAWGDGAFLQATTSDDPAAIRILTVLHNADHNREALAVADACLDDARRRGSLMSQATWVHLRGHVLQYMGRLLEAEKALRSAFSARERGWGAWLPVNAAALVYLAIERDDLDAAQATSDAARASTTHPRPSPQWANLDAACGRLELARGRPEEALRLCRRAGERARLEMGTENPALGPWWADELRALLSLGRRQEALGAARQALRAAETWGAPRAVGTARMLHALTGPASERPDGLRAAVAQLQSAETRLDYGYALLALGTEERDHDPQRAREMLRSAVDVATECDSTRLARLAGDELRAAGGRPRRRRLAGPDSLTDSERRIADLAADGLSNQEIADQVYVTSGTVAFHLGNVYRKLAITGRGELSSVLP